MLKVYRSKKFMSLSLPLEIGDRLVIAEFKGGCVNPRVCGSYVTMDEGVQAALEGEPGFNRDYFLEKTVAPGGGHIGLHSDAVTPGGVRVETGGIPGEVVEVEGWKAEDGGCVNEVLEGVSKVQEAAAYLCERFGVDRCDVNTKAKIRSFIADKGIVFPKLNLGDGKE